MNTQYQPIVDAVEADVPGLTELLAELFGIEQDFAADNDKQVRGLQLLIAAPERGVVKVAHDTAGNVIGMVSAQLVISTAEGGFSAWIEDMVVHRDYRARGLGRLLLDAALAWAKTRGATRAQLLVDLGNPPALAYYERLGWQSLRMGARRLHL